MTTEKNWTGERLATFIVNENMVEHLHRYAIAQGYARGRRVLDIACGEGYGSNLLAQVAQEVTGVDIDEPTIREAAQKYRRPNLTFRAGSADRIPMEDGAVDLVVSFETLEHLSAHTEMLSEIRRVLSAGGILLLSTPDKKRYSDLRNYRNPFHARELYAAEFEALVRGQFRYAAFLHQQYLSGSLVFERGNAGTLTTFSGSYEMVSGNAEPEGMYLIAVASNDAAATLSPGHSFFTGEHLVEAAVAEAVRRVRASRSYRLGSLLLSPFKLFRRK